LKTGRSQHGKEQTDENTKIGTDTTPAKVDVSYPEHILSMLTTKWFMGPVKGVGLLEPKGFKV
jgi:hypothetical protein